MMPSHQCIAVGIGVVVALSHPAPVWSEVNPEAPSTSAKTSSLEADSSPSSAASNAESTPAAIDKASPVQATPATPTPATSNADPATVTTKPESIQTGTPAAQPTPSPAANQPIETPEATPQRQPGATQSTPAPTNRSKPGAASKPGKVKPTPKTRPTVQTPTVRPINLADFKAWQNQPVTQVPMITPGATTPPGQPNPGSIPVFTPPPSGTNVPDVGVSSQPIGPAKPGAAPEYLNPNANPLTIPTRPEDVQLRGIQPITLLQAIELAKRNNRDLQVAILQLERSRASLREAQAALYPTLGTQFNLTQAQTAAGELQERATRQAQAALPPQFRSEANSDRSNLALNGALQLGYNIYTGGQRPARIRAAEQQVRIDQLAVEISEQEIRFQTADAYYNVQEADEAVRIQQSAVRNAEASLRDTVALERAGLGTRFDVLRAQVQLANAQQDLTNALSNQRIRRRQLVQGLAVPVYIDLAAADPVGIAGSWNLTLPQTIVLALKNRAELEQQLAQRELAEQQRRLALTALNPTVNLQLQYNVLNNLRDTLGFADGYSLTAGFNWNFFDGGAARARANQQEANKAIAETRFAQVRENIQLQVESSFANLQSTFLNIGTNRQAVAQAREALRLARLRFQAGVGTQTEVINAENDLTRAEGNLVTAIIGYNRALASLQRSVTNLPIATGATTPSIPGPAPQLPPITPF